MNLSDLSVQRMTSADAISQLGDLRAFLDEAFDGDFSDEDFDHAFGGTHFAILTQGRLVAHGSVVMRQITFDERAHATGFVEAMAVGHEWRGRGVGSKLLAELTDFCRSNFAVAMLSTGSHAFYEKHGWRRFNGESYLATDAGVVRTEEDDDGLMLLTSLEHVLAADRVTCDFRSGDVW
jgi:aminoglycoside 2'-N-acetyltransferase I